MDPIAMLMKEHRDIERVLQALEVFSKEVGASARLADLSGFAAWLHAFVDGCHHGKEEDLLFDALVEHGAAGELKVLSREHEEARALFEALHDQAQRASWSRADLDRVRALSLATVRLLRGHIEKEDGVLLPLAQKQLGVHQLEVLARRFERYEQEEGGSGEHLRLAHLAEALVDRYQPAAQTDASGC
jgi:hemerythrin-like domain-containing protein